MLHKSVVQRLANQRDAALLQVGCGRRVEAFALLFNQFASLVRRVVLAKELVDQAQAHGELVGGAVVHGKHAVLVVGELGEAVDVLPHALVRGMEQVRTVFVHLNAGFWFFFAVCVSADVVALFHHQHTLAQLARGLLRHGQAEKPGSNNNEVICHRCHFRTVAFRRCVSRHAAKSQGSREG